MRMRRQGGGIESIRVRLFMVWAGCVLGLLLSVSDALGQNQTQRAADAQDPQQREDRSTQQAEAARTDRQPDHIDALLEGIDPAMLNLSGTELDYEIVGGQMILRGNARDLDLIELLVRYLESETEQKELRVVTVTEKDAQEIAQSLEPALQNIFEDPNQRSELELRITALSSRILLVSALPDQIDWIVDLIKQVDETEDMELPAPEQLVFSIKHRRATDVADQLREIVGKIRERQGATGPKGELQIIPNNANNSIMVLAPETEREKIQQLLNELDVEPVKGWGEVKLTLFPLLHSKAREMADVIEELLATKGDREAAEEMIHRLQISKALPDGEIVELPPIDLQKPTRILPDEGTNSLVVATVEENVGPMGELIRLLDGVPMAEDIGVKLFPLKFADAEKLASLLKDMFDSGEQLTKDPDGSGEGAVPDSVIGSALVYPVHISSDPRSNTLVTSGRQEHLVLITQMVGELDRPAVVHKELRVVAVTEKDASNIASTVEEVLRNVFFEPDQKSEFEISVSPMASNIVLVSALPHQIDIAVDLIKQVDSLPEQLPGPDQLVFAIQYRRASLVAEELLEIVNQLREKQGASGEIQIIPNDANNTIMVLAPEADREKIEGLLNGLDVEPVEGWGEVKLTLFPLIHSKANELGDVITDLLASQEDREDAEEFIYRLQISKALPTTGEIVDLPSIDLQRPTRIIPDEGTNSLIVATVEENVGPMGELIRLLDGVPMAEEVDVRFFPLRFADAETIGELLKEMFDEGKTLPEDPDGSGQNAVPEGPFGSAIVYNIGVSADVRTNTLIVSGRQEQLDLVETIVTKLDRPATALKFPLRMIQLEHTDASQIGKIITELLDQRFEALEGTGAGKAAIERERVFLSVDLRSNSLIVSASEENYEEILSITRQLDTKPARLFDQIRIISCQRLSAADLKEKIDELWQRKAELRREEELLEDIPILVVDGRSNSLIVASNVEDYEEIVRLVDTLESRPLIEDARLFKLEYADAAVLAGMLDELFQGIAGQSEAFQAPTILPDPRSNALVVAAARDAMERAEDLIKRLDVESGPLTAVFQVYALRHASATQLAPRIQELFDSREQGQEVSRTPIVIMADETSNSLVCSASRDDHEIIVDLLGLLDRPSNLARQFEIFPLKRAKAATVAEKLGSLFQSQADGASGRADAIASEADERTNSIIVWASPSQMMNIAEVIKRLDTSTPAVETMIKVIQLKQALAEDFAELLRQTVVGEDAGSDNERAVIVSFLEKQRDGTDVLRKLLRQDIKIEADPRTNSLMVMAPSDSIAMLEAMIRDFDTIRPIRSEIRLFPLINSDAEGIVDQLTELFETDGGDGETKSQLVFGDTIGDTDIASVGQDLRFAADTRTNTLIAAGAEVDLRMVEELVRYLDAQEVEDRVTVVYPASYRSAQDLASAVQGFNQQEQDVLGEVDDEEARTRRMERQVSVEAVGDEEEGSSSLIVGTSRRRYQETMDMIRELDRPEPQVMISVLIADVTLTDNLEFGMEFAGQELDFSREAIVGPNGIIEGPDFDWVSGTQLGAAGSGLGFGFTINGEDFSFLLHALQQNSRLELLSRPILMVRNGEEGSITIADEVPFVESSQINDTGSTNSVIGRESVGIVLTTTPHISPDGYVTIELSQELSNFAGENLQLTEGVSSPIFQTREVKTNVTVRDGETVVIGGLITTRKSEGENKVPILGDIPGLGVLFRTTSVSETRTELLIVMTVDVVRTAEDVRRMSVEQRDKYIESRPLHHSPLLEGLRIVPDESLLGPVDATPAGPQKETEPAPDQRDLYGPKPETYGPVIPRPRPTTTTTTPVYGPKVVRNDATVGGS